MDSRRVATPFFHLYGVVANSTMGRTKGKPNTSPQERAAICHEYRDGVSPTQISRNFGISKSAVFDIWHRYKNATEFFDAPKAGGPSKLNARDLRHLDRIVRLNPRKVLGDIRRIAFGWGNG